MTEWDPELTELERRRELAARMGGEERVARQHAAGRLTVRERIERLVDKESFTEVGGLTGSARQLAAIRLTIDTASDATQLYQWLAGENLPDAGPKRRS